MSIRGPRSIAVLCARCLAVLVVGNLVGLGIAYSVVGSDAAYESGLTAVLAYFPGVGMVSALVIAVFGFPAGLLTARLVGEQHRERAHVLAFALVGATLSVTLCAMWSMLGTVGWAWVLAVAEGAFGAGIARWWSGRVHARTAPWTDVQGAALPWGSIGP